MASLTQWTRVWTNSRRQWRTGKPGVLQSMGVTKSRTWLSSWTTTTLNIIIEHLKGGEWGTHGLSIANCRMQSYWSLLDSWEHIHNFRGKVGWEDQQTMCWPKGSCVLFTKSGGCSAWLQTSWPLLHPSESLVDCVLEMTPSSFLEVPACHVGVRGGISPAALPLPQHSLPTEFLIEFLPAKCLMTSWPFTLFCCLPL